MRRFNIASLRYLQALRLGIHNGGSPRSKRRYAKRSLGLVKLG